MRGKALWTLACVCFLGAGCAGGSSESNASDETGEAAPLDGATGSSADVGTTSLDGSVEDVGGSAAEAIEGDGESADGVEVDAIREDGAGDPDAESADVVEVDAIQEDAAVADVALDTSVAPDALDVSADASEQQSTTESFTLENPWNIAVHATLHSPAGEGPTPAVLLIHQYNQSSAQWEPWIPGLLAHGWRVLALDLPFHGASEAIPGVGQPDLLDSPDLAPPIILSALEWLGKSGGADPERIAIVGTSIGANLACVFNANASPLGLGAKLGVAISPRDTAVFQLAGNPKSIGFTGMYFLASADDNDGVQAATCTTFAELTDPPVEVVIVPDSAAHGLFLLQEDPGLWSGIDAFLATHL